MKFSLVDLRVWAVLLTLGLAASLWVSHAERGAAVARADSLAADVNELRGDLAARTDERDQARAHAVASDARLTDYAAQSAQAFKDQADASARMAAELAAVNRRLRAAQQEISRADAGLRLDDPLPRVVRDGLACAGGDAAACAGGDAVPADPRDLSPGAADGTSTTGAAARGDDRA